MPDITMCSFNCPISKTCYRHEAIPSDYQCWFTTNPSNTGTPTATGNFTQKSLRENYTEGFHCVHYWKVDDAPTRIKYKKIQGGRNINAD